MIILRAQTSVSLSTPNHLRKHCLTNQVEFLVVNIKLTTIWIFIVVCSHWMKIIWMQSKNIIFSHPYRFFFLFLCRSYIRNSKNFILSIDQVNKSLYNYWYTILWCIVLWSILPPTSSSFDLTLILLNGLRYRDGYFRSHWRWGAHFHLTQLFSSGDQLWCNSFTAVLCLYARMRVSM